MKKHLLFLFAALLPLLASAHNFEIDGIYYNITSNTEARVTFKGDSYSSYEEYSGSITIPATVTYNGKEYSVTSIGYSAFYGCSSLTAINIPEGVTFIGYDAFRECYSLTDINIPEDVTSIGSSAFYNCRSLTSITIPESVTSIGNYAFYGCSSLTAITIPESVTSIGDHAFMNCSSLTDINIPEGVTSIGDRTFCYCSRLKSINIPENSQLTSIGYGAFEICSSLTAITIPEGVTSIGEYAFSSCRNLTSINIPEGVTSIEKYAFYGCSSLTSITIPEGVTRIGSSAFCNCSSLTAITCHAMTPPTIGSSKTFNKEIRTIPVYVPAGSVKAYKAAAYWSEFTNIQAIPNEFTLMVSAAGYATLYLDYAVDIPDNVKAYIATSVEGDRLMMTRVTGVLPAETGVIVRAEAGEYTFAESEDTPANVEGNLLSGSSANKTITAESGYRYYVLAKKNDVVAMYHPQLTDGKFTNMANKAYLALKADDLGIYDDETNTEDEGGQLSNRLRFDFGGTTDIEMTTDNRQQTTDNRHLRPHRPPHREPHEGRYLYCKW